MPGLGLGIGLHLPRAKRRIGSIFSSAGASTMAARMASRWTAFGLATVNMRDGEEGAGVWTDLDSAGTSTFAFRSARKLTSAGAGAFSAVARPFAAITSPTASSSHSAQTDVTITVSGTCARATSVEVFASVDGGAYASWGTDSSVGDGTFSVTRTISAGDAGDTPPGSVTLKATATGTGGTKDSATVAITVTDDLGDSELEGWSGLKAWIDPKDISSLTYSSQPTQVDVDMEAGDTSAWSSARATLSKVSGSPGGSGSQVLRITATSASPYARQFGLTNGCRYNVSGWARGDGTIAPRTSISSSIHAWTGTNSTSWQAISGNVTCTANASEGWILYGVGGAAANWVEFDNTVVTNISVASIDPRAGSLTSAFSQATAANQPWIDTTTGAIRFDGSADVLNYSGTVGDFKFLHYHATEANNLPLFTVMCVANSTVATTDNVYGSYNTTTPGIQLCVLATGQVDFNVYNASAAIATVSSSTGAVTAGNAFVHEGWSEGGSASLNQLINGAAAGAADTSWGTTSSADPIALSLGSSYSTSRLDGTVGDVVIFDRALSATERLRLRVKLAKKWGITLP